MGRYQLPKKEKKKETKKLIPSELNINQFRKLRHLLLNDIPNHIIKHLGAKECCMSISWVVASVLNAYEIECIPRRVKCSFVNRYGINYIRKHGVKAFWKAHESTIGEEGKKIWTVGLGYDDGSFDPLHAIVVFKEGSILDMTADQASRPEHDMVIKRYWATKKMPSYIIHFQFTDVPITSGAIVKHPRFMEMFNYVLERVAKALGERDKIAFWNKDGGVTIVDDG